MYTRLCNSISFICSLLHIGGIVAASVAFAPGICKAQYLNTTAGQAALYSNTTGSYSTALGAYSLFYNTTGSYNTATGIQALYCNTTGGDNSANGAYALYFNTTGQDDSAFGVGALYSNNTGSGNAATGAYALYFNTDGYSNTANGVTALYSNTTGSFNVADGTTAMYSNQVGSFNTASGYWALYHDIANGNNVAIGYGALYMDTQGYNTAVGSLALEGNTSGGENTAVGNNALSSNTVGNNNTAIGAGALENPEPSTGSNNIGVGAGAGSGFWSGSYNIMIGNPGLSTDGTSTNAGVIRIGNSSVQTSTYIAGISGVTTSGGVAVYINSSGQLGTLTSSQRFKNDIRDIGSASDKLMQLRPVSFRYKDSAEKGPHLKQYGLIAEEVAKVYPELVQYDKQGKPFTVYYHLLTPMLLNELQKEHRQVVSQKMTINALGTKLAAQDARHKSEIAALKSQLSSMKVAQERQAQLLTKLADLVQSQPNQGQMHTTALVQH